MTEAKPVVNNAVSGKEAAGKVAAVGDGASPQSVRQLAEEQEINEPIPLENDKFDDKQSVFDGDASSRVFHTRNVINSTSQLQVINVTMHVPPKNRRRRTRHLRQMMRTVRNTLPDDPVLPRPHPQQ